MLLAHVVIYCPIYRLGRLHRKAEEFILVTVGGLRLVIPVHNPVIHSQLAVEVVVDACTGVIEGQEIEVVRAGGLPAQIAAYRHRTGQAPPATDGEFARAILESLALRYRNVVENLESLTGRKIEVIHIVGGGSRNTLLNQFVADCTGRRVVAGPSEATAIGNILVQAMGAGELADLAAARSVVRNSFELTTVDPHPSPEWERAYQRYF